MLQMRHLNLFVSSVVWMMLHRSLCNEENKGPDEYCQSENFQPKCSKNEVILMTTAVYGRMRIGNCVKANEVAVQKNLTGDASLFLGCSADVLHMLNKICSGKTDCDVPVSPIPFDNIQPCLPGLNLHLEASYDCINIVDEKRSCVITTSKNPVYVLSSSDSPSICGSRHQPWIVEAPSGQKVSVSLLYFTASHSAHSQEHNKESCHSLVGLIVDKIAKRNLSICEDNKNRPKEIYMSAGNKVTLYLGPPSDPKESSASNWRFILKFEAVGCSDVIPPEDTWLKRNNDTILIGCYSSRQTWQLTCKGGGKWIGVLGNCSHDITRVKTAEGSETKSSITSEEQVLAILAIGGCTLAICLAIVCIGAVSLRRFYVQARKKQSCKTLNYSTNPAVRQELGRLITTGFASGDCTENDASLREMPTYSVYAGRSDFNNVDNQITS